MYQYLFQNCQIIDGTGAPARVGDVAVSGDKIAKVAAKIDDGAQTVVDGKGKLLCPGFIDVHSHSDISLLYENRPDSKIFQGVTTEVVGNCGFSPFPMKQDTEWMARRRTSLAFIDVDGFPWDWEDFSEYRKRFDVIRPNVNLLPLVGHGSIRAMVMGYDNRKASEDELKAMCSLLEEHLQNGTAGLSTGLGYPPDFYGDEDELTALAKVVKTYDRIFAFHIRGERATQFKAMDEVISVGRGSGAKVHISHLKCAGIHNRGRSEEMIAKVRGADCDITFDMYPYTAGSSNLGLVFPPAFHEGGTEALLERLQDPVQVEEIIRQMENGTAGWSTFIGEFQGRNLRITGLKGHKECIGKSLWEIGEEWGCSPSQAAIRLMKDEKGKVEMVMFMVEEDDLDRIAMYPGCLYGTDGLAMGDQKPLIRQMPHPRYYGSFTTLLERYGKTGKIPLEQLISQMTGQAAKRFGIAGRGVVKAGYAADLILIDMEHLKTMATYEEPCQRSKGIEYLMVNGKPEIADGKKTEETGGRMLSC